ncbi:MAG: hypothetical protein ACTS73_08895 [Arsenophonus sp. NEOnobi-MAG3]
MFIFFVDAIFSLLKQDESLFLLLIIDVTEHGRKEFIAVEDAYKKSEANYRQNFSMSCKCVA